jgi:hypothetical protein
MVVSHDIWSCHGGVDKDSSRFGCYAMSTGKRMDPTRCVPPYLLHPTFLPSHYFCTSHLATGWCLLTSCQFNRVSVQCIVPPAFAWLRHQKGPDTYVSQHGQLIAVENGRFKWDSAPSSSCLLFESFSHNLKKPKFWLISLRLSLSQKTTRPNR